MVDDAGGGDQEVAVGNWGAIATQKEGIDQIRAHIHFTSLFGNFIPYFAEHPWCASLIATAPFWKDYNPMVSSLTAGSPSP